VSVPNTVLTASTAVGTAAGKSGSGSQGSSGSAATTSSKTVSPSRVRAMGWNLVFFIGLALVVWAVKDSFRATKRGC
jgi:hypothetical protein